MWLEFLAPMGRDPDKHPPRQPQVPERKAADVDAPPNGLRQPPAGERLDKRESVNISSARKIAPIQPVGCMHVLGGVERCVRRPRPSAPTGMSSDKHPPRLAGSDGHEHRAPGSDRHPLSCSGLLWLRTISPARCLPRVRSAPTVGPDGHELCAPGSDWHGAGVPGSDGQRPRQASAPTTASARKESC
jgi:hypothetical protein